MYDKGHRALLRTLLARGVVPLREAGQLLQQVTGERESVKDYIRVINNEIRPFQQNLKIATDELTNEEFVIFLSLGLDDITKSQTLFSQAELQYYRVLLEHILTTDQRQISVIAALNLVATIKTSLTKHEAEKLLDKFCDMFYLSCDDDNYSLGIRSIHEMEGYIKRNMPDVLEECTLCQLVVFRGVNCPRCAVAVHTRCLNKYLERVKQWPCCKSEYTGLADPADYCRGRLTQEMSQIDASQASQSTVVDTTGHPDTMDEMPSTSQAGHSDEESLSQLGISQSSAVRKRKRQW